MLLILRVLPRDPQFVPCVNQNPAALKNDSDKKVSDKKIEVLKNKDLKVLEDYFFDTVLVRLNSGENHKHCLLQRLQQK